MCINLLKCRREANPTPEPWGERQQCWSWIQRSCSTSGMLHGTKYTNIQVEFWIGDLVSVKDCRRKGKKYCQNTYIRMLQKRGTDENFTATLSHVYRIILLNEGSPSACWVLRCQPSTLNSTRGVREQWCHAKVANGRSLNKHQINSVHWIYSYCSQCGWKSARCSRQLVFAVFTAVTGTWKATPDLSRRDAWLNLPSSLSDQCASAKTSFHYNEQREKLSGHCGGHGPEHEAFSLWPHRNSHS